MRIGKFSSLREASYPKSSRQHREAGQQDQPTDQLLPNNDTRVWTEDGGKIPCEGKQGSENSQEMLSRKRECAPL